MPTLLVNFFGEGDALSVSLHIICYCNVQCDKRKNELTNFVVNFFVVELRQYLEDEWNSDM